MKKTLTLLLLFSCGFRNNNNNDSGMRSAVPVVDAYIVANNEDEYIFHLPEGSILLDSSQKKVDGSFTTDKIGDYKFYAAEGDREIKKWNIKARANIEHTERRSKFEYTPLKMEEMISVQFMYKDKGFELSDLKDISGDNITLDIMLHGYKLGEAHLSLHAFQLFVEQQGKDHTQLQTFDDDWKLVVKDDEKVLTDGFILEGIDIDNTKLGKYSICAKIDRDYTNQVQLNIYPNIGDIDAKEVVVGSYSEVDLADLGSFKAEDLFTREGLVFVADNNKTYILPLKSESFNGSLDITIDKFKVGSLTININPNITYSEPNDKWPGLPNRGNTCFANATFSALAATKYVDYTNHVSPVAKYLQTILNSKRLGEKSLYRVSALAKKMIDNFKVVFNKASANASTDSNRRKGNYFKICGRQEDVGDFMSGIMQVINDFSATVHALTPYSVIDISSFIYGEDGQPASSQEDLLGILTLNGSRKTNEIWDVSSKLEQFFSEEQLGDPDVLSDHPNAKNKRLLPTKMPKLLIIQLKRFMSDWDRKAKKVTISKLNNKVKIQKELEVDCYTASQTNLNELIKAGSKLYKVRSIVCHSGSLSGGHYWAYIKGENEWYKHDDSSVSVITADRALNGSEQYVILYEEVE